MTLLTIPNRPLGNSPPHIADLLANFDSITGVINTSLIGRRSLALSTQARVGSGNSGGTYIWCNGDAYASGVDGLYMACCHVGDSGISGQPQNFQLSGTTFKAVIRASLFVNTNANTGSVTISTIGLATLTSGGSSGSSRFTANTGSPTFSFNPGWSAVTDGSHLTAISSTFTMPTTAGNYGIYVTAGTISTGYIADITAQLYIYNT